MGYYAKNPHDQDEPPRCVECDQTLTPVTIWGQRWTEWECTNTDCEACPDKYRLIRDLGKAEEAE